MPNSISNVAFLMNNAEAYKKQQPALNKVNMLYLETSATPRGSARTTVFTRIIPYSSGWSG